MSATVHTGLKRAPRILFCTQSAYVRGGVEEWLWSLVRTLAERDWDVLVGVARGRRFHRPDRFLRHYPYARVSEIDGSSGFGEQRYRALLRLYARTKPDIVLPVQLADALYAAAAWKRRGGDGRVVCCLHGQFPAVIADLRRCAGDIDFAVSVSRLGAERLRSGCGIPASRVVHIPTGVPAPVAGTAGQPDDELHLGYVGRLDDGEKRVSDLVPLLGLMKDDDRLRVHVVGDGPQRGRLESALAAYRADGRVIFHGVLDRRDVYTEIYPWLHGLLIFSPAEGGPMAAWEAMRHGVVPVTSDFRGREEEGVLRDGANCLVFPVGDMRAAAACVARLRCPSVFRALSDGARGLDLAYTEEGFAIDWDQVLRRVLELPRRQGVDALPSLASPGRLARLLGNDRLLWAVRRVAAKPFRHDEPGGEWPHAYNGFAPVTEAD